MFKTMSSIVLAASMAFASPSLAFSISGNVVCEGDGTALEGIQVTAETGTPGTGGFQSFSATTDPLGDYLVDDVGPSVWSMSLDTPYTYTGPTSVDLTVESFASGVDFVVDDPECDSHFCGDGFVDEDEECDDGNNEDGDGCSAVCEFEGGDGCTPGYWKQPHHFDSWTAPLTPDTLFGDIFEDAFPGMTLHDVLSQGGGGLKALGRHTVAALLNAASAGVDYSVDVSDIIDAFDDVYPGSNGAYQTLKNIFETENELGCPLN